MHKIVSTVLSLLLIYSIGNAQIVINEILPSVPGAGEDEEYIELHNTTAASINLQGYVFRDASASYTLGNVSIAANGYFIIARDSVVFTTSFGIVPDADWNGFLGTAEYLVLEDNTGSVIDSVDYASSAPWPTIPTSGTSGYSLQLCDASTDNNVASNWGTSQDSAGVNNQATTVTLYGTPGAANNCPAPPPAGVYVYQSISQINSVDANGVPVSLGDSVEIRAVVHCSDFDGNAGYYFTFVEYNNVGITVFNSSDINGYSNVMEGDSLHIFGRVSQFNGLLQLAPDSISLISSGNATVAPMNVSMLDESTEGKVLQLDSIYLADPILWVGTGGSFTVQVVTLNNDTLSVRVDGDIALADSSAPAGLFNLYGIGNQFDGTSPYTSGYQLMACDYALIDTNTVTPPPAGPVTNLVISEINYNVPGVDSVEFVEIYNNDTMTIDLAGYQISSGIFYTFPTVNLAPGQFVLITNDSVAFQNAFGITAWQWDSGNSLNNTGETILLLNPSLATVDSVTYADGAPWPAGTDGQGASIQLCDVNADNADPANWGASSNPTGVSLGGVEVLATPGNTNTTCTIVTPGVYVYQSISDINSVDASGLPLSQGDSVELRAVVHCGDFRSGSGLDFYMIEYDNVGINVFNVNDVSAYAVTEGDSIHAFGVIDQYNGKLEIIVDSISVISQGNATVSAMATTVLDESTEGKLLAIENVTLADPAAWTGAGTGFNVGVVSGNDTLTVRIDNDVDLFTQPAPTGIFSIYGIGSQFDPSNPYTSGYQLLACNSSISVSNQWTEAAQPIKIFPNPTHSVLNVVANNIEMVVIHNMLGQEVLRINNVNSAMLSINTTELSKGVYTINIMENGKMKSQQFIKH